MATHIVRQPLNPKTNQRLDGSFCRRKWDSTFISHELGASESNKRNFDQNSNL
jgi:hypothetical protein